MPLSDFDPRYPELWRDGAVRPVKIPQPDHGKAISMRHRLYRCRAAMLAEGHPYAAQAGKVSVSVIGVDKDGNEHKFSTVQRLLPLRPSDLKWHLLLDNADKDFDDALAQAGYPVPEAPSLDD